MKNKSGWKTHKAAVRTLERVLGAPLKKVGRSGIYEVELPAGHTIAQKLEQVRRKPKRRSHR